MSPPQPLKAHFASSFWDLPESRVTGLMGKLEWPNSRRYRMNFNSCLEEPIDLAQIILNDRLDRNSYLRPNLYEDTFQAELADDLGLGQ